MQTFYEMIAEERAENICDVLSRKFELARDSNDAVYGPKLWAWISAFLQQAVRSKSKEVMSLPALFIMVAVMYVRSACRSL